MALEPPAAEGVRVAPSRRAKLAGLAILFVAYAAFAIGPILVRLSRDKYFGWDVGQYLLTAREGVLGGAPLFHYPFPLVPAAYLPLTAANPSLPLLYGLADLLSGLLMLALFVSAGALGFALTRSAAGGAACALMVGTFSLLLGDVGLGAQSQLLAFVLGALGLATLVGGVPRRWPLRPALTAGILLGLAVLAESYSAAYFVLAALLFCALLEGRRTLRWEAAREYWPVLLLPVVAGGATLLSGSGALLASPTRPVLSGALTIGGWERAAAGVGFGSPVNIAGYSLLMLAIVLSALFGTRPSRRVGAGFGATFLACIAQVLLLTPAIYWDRGELFVVFPLAVGAAAVIGGLSAMSTRAARPSLLPLQSPLGSRSARTSRWVNPACAVVVVAVLFAQAAVAYELYPTALERYSVDPGALSQLRWLRDMPGGVLAIAPAAEAFSIADAIGRPTLPMSQPIWFDTPSERSAVELADKLAVGSSWITDGPLSVVNSSLSSNATSSVILDARFPYFVNLLQVAEGEGTSPERLVTGAGAASGSAGGSAPTTASFSGSGELPTYSVAEETSIAANGSVVCNFSFRSTGALEPVYLAFEVPRASLDRLTEGHATAVLAESFAFGGNPRVRFFVRATVEASPGVEVSPAAEGSIGGVPTVTWPLVPGPGFEGNEFNVSLEISIPGGDYGSPSFTNESSAFSEHDVRWVVVDAGTEESLLPRFEADPTLSLDWSGAGFDVFSVR